MKLKNSRDLSIEEVDNRFDVSTATDNIGQVHWAPLRKRYCFFAHFPHPYAASDLSTISEWLTIINATKKSPS